MKSVMKFFIMMLVSSSLMLSSCKDDDDDDDDIPSYTNELKAKVGGADFSVSNPTAKAGNGVLAISGINAAGSLHVTMLYNAKVGTYTITDVSEESVVWNTGQSGYWPVSGTIEVEKHDEVNNIAEGKFKASLEDVSTNAPLEVTDGVFKVKYK